MCVGADEFHSRSGRGVFDGGDGDVVMANDEDEHGRRVVTVEVHPLAQLLHGAVASGAIERGSAAYAAIYAIVMRGTGNVQRLPWSHAHNSQALDPAVWRAPLSLTSAMGAATTLTPLFELASEAFVAMPRRVHESGREAVLATIPR